MSRSGEPSGSCDGKVKWIAPLVEMTTPVERRPKKVNSKGSWCVE
jgi:hypothetical protein